MGSLKLAFFFDTEFSASENPPGDFYAQRTLVQENKIISVYIAAIITIWAF